MKYSKWIKYWLILGCIFILFQIVIGGITRLTGSGLSITRWEIVTGSIPPLNEVSWNEEFDKYRETPQYKKINKGMSLKEFKFIYFWEYFHRLWARMMSIVFFVPLIIFAYLKMLDGYITKRLFWIIVFAGLTGVFGWIMVASGLIERPWVNAYKLSIHLSLALITLLCCVKAILDCFYNSSDSELYNGGYSVKYRWLYLLLWIQILLGSIVSGMRAALLYPTWPSMNKSFVPDVLQNFNNWTITNLKEYDVSLFAPTLFQFLHRNTAYIIFIFSIYLLFLLVKNKIGVKSKRIYYLYFSCLVVQILLGIYTLIGSKGSIPVDLGVMHQFFGIITLTVFYIFKYPLFYIKQKAHQ